MSKDPAFLFYTNDFLSGIQDLTFEERGQYITLLCLQHQKGHLSDKLIKLSVGNAAADVMAKFRQDSEGLWFNARLDLEIEKRKAHGEKQRERALEGWKKRKEKPEGSQKDSTGNAAALPLEDVNEDEIVIVDKDKYNKESILILLDRYQIQLNGFQRENNNLAWRPLVPAWFAEHIGEEFADDMHAKNSFKRFYMSKKEKKFNDNKPQLSAKELYDLGK